MSPRTVALLCLCLSACGKEAESAPSEPAAKPPGSMPARRLPPNDPHATPPPDEPEQPPLPASAPGTFDVTIGDRLTHFRRIPRGQNRAVVMPDADVARVSIAAFGGDEAWPHIRIILEGFRPDQAEYPLTLSSTQSKSKGKDAVSVSARYEVSDKRIYQVDHDKDAEIEVTLDAYEGETLRGSFSGALAPTAAGLGDPIAISGKFSVELGLRNVEPGPPAG